MGKVDEMNDEQIHNWSGSGQYRGKNFILVNKYRTSRDVSKNQITMKELKRSWDFVTENHNYWVYAR